MSKKPELKWLDEDLVQVRWANGPVAARLFAERKTGRKTAHIMHVAGYTYQVALRPEAEVKPGFSW